MRRDRNHRRTSFRLLWKLLPSLGLAGYVAGLLLAGAWPAAAAPPNVLMIVVDDLNDWVGCLGGHPQARTPHLDALAARGTLFSNAHCQAPLCNPSRSSVFTGLRPSTTGIYGLAPSLLEIASLREHATLPQTFRQQGYFTYACGKIYHDASPRSESWKPEFEAWGPAPGMPLPPKKFVATPASMPAMDWGVFPERDEQQADWAIASGAVQALESAPRDRPFFVACGFRLPHVPCFASARWFDLYPSETLQLPLAPDGDRDDVPRFAWYLHWDLPEPRLKFLKEHDQWKPLVRAYLASTSFMDSQIGRVLAALDQSGRAEETIVVLWSDHGFHLGEQQITGKNTLWERSTRVPLIFAGPGVAAQARCARPVELLDIFPTLIDLCGLPARSDLEGHSLKPLLQDAQAERPWPAITTHNQNNHAVRTQDWRYIRYADGSEELYHTAADPHEWTNLAARPEHTERKRGLAAWLPQTNRPPVPGSAHRLLTYDPRSGATTWEGKPIPDSAPIPGIED